MILPFDQLCHICIKLRCCFSGIIKARASGSKVYLYFMKKGRHRILRNSCEQPSPVCLLTFQKQVHQLSLRGQAMMMNHRNTMMMFILIQMKKKCLQKVILTLTAPLPNPTPSPKKLLNFSIVLDEAVC